MATVTATFGLDTFNGISNTTAGTDVINAANGTATAGDSWNGGDGTDAIQLTSNGVKMDMTAASISNIENLTGGRRNDVVTMSLSQLDGFSKVDLAKGKDNLIVKAAGAVDVSAGTLASFVNTETIKLVGSTGGDTVTMSSAQLSLFSSVAMDAGNDKLGLTSTSAKLNTYSDSSLTGLEAISMATAAAGVTIDLHLQTEAFTITGSSNDDTIIGSRGADQIAAGNGDDSILLASGQFIAGEVLNGGGGTDKLVLSATGLSIDLSTGTLTNVETIQGGSGNDTVTLDAAQWAGVSAIDLGLGTNVVNIRASGDISGATVPVISNVAASNLIGSTGDDSFKVSGLGLMGLVTGTGVINFGSGADILNMTTGSIVLRTLGATDAAISGLETISVETAGVKANILMVGQTENFTLIGNALHNVLQGGSGADSLSGGGGKDKLIGGDGDDTLAGGTGIDRLNGGAGLDTLDYSGSATRVVVNLASGDSSGGDAEGDLISGIENLKGSEGADLLSGNALSNVLAGNGGKDVLLGGGGADHLEGGLGADTASYRTSAEGVTVDLITGLNVGGDAQGDVLVSIEKLAGSEFGDNLTGTGLNNQIRAYGGNDTVTANNGKDKVDGGTGNDTIDGGSGNDKLSGGAGKDAINGGADNDQLTGAGGVDTLTGGDGNDVFVFHSFAEAGKGASADTIADFIHGADRIDLSGMDANAAADGNQAFTLIAGTVFSHSAGELIYNSATGILSGNAGTDAKADFQIKLDIGLTLTDVDFIL